MDIRELQNYFVLCASGLGNYQALTKTELANGYCLADEKQDEVKRSQYWAALLLRYWYKIFEWAKSSESCKLPLEDFFDWLHDSLCDAFYYRSWWWEYEAVVREGKFIEWKLDEHGNKIPNEHYWKVDENAPDKSINYFCAARRAKEYQALNKDKRKSNVLSQSLDASREEVGDSALEQAGAYEEGYSGNSLPKDLVVKFLEQGRLVEALIIDGIAYHDAFKETKNVEVQQIEEDLDEDDLEEYYVSIENTWCIYGQNTGIKNTGDNTPEVKKGVWWIGKVNTGIEYHEIKPEVEEQKIYSYEHSFDKRKLVKHLTTINQEFMNSYFIKAYDLTPEEGNEILERLHKLNNISLYKYIDKTLINLKNENVVKYFLGA